MCVINWENNFKSQQKCALTFILGRLSVISFLVCTEGRKKWHRMVEKHNRHRVLTTSNFIFFSIRGLSRVNYVESWKSDLHLDRPRKFIM